MTLMKLKLALIIDDLAFRLMVSSTTASSIFITWVKLMSKELSVLITGLVGSKLNTAMQHVSGSYIRRCGALLIVLNVSLKRPVD